MDTDPTAPGDEGATPSPPGEAAAVPAEPVDAGVVPPPDTDAAEATAAPDGGAAPAVAAAGSSIKPLAVVGAVALAVAVIVGGIWFVQRARGAADESLRAIPEDMAFVVGLDLLGFEDTAGVDRVVAAFSDEISAELETDEPVRTVEDLVAAFEDAFSEEADLDLEEEVYPWIGRSAALGVRDVTAATEVPDVIAAVSLRDEEGARRFLYERLPAHLEESGEETATVTPDEDGDILRIGTEDDAPYISVREGLLLLASSEAALDEATATAAGGDSITGNDQFAAATAEVADQGLWFYADFDAVAESAADDPDLDEIAELDIEGYVAAGVGLTESGITVDFTGEVSGEGFAEAIPQLGASTFRDGLPAGTVAYLGFAFEGDESLGDRLEQVAGEEPEALLDDLAADDPEMGAQVEKALDTLTGEFELAVMSGRANMLIPIDGAFALALGVVDRAAGDSLVDDLVGLVSGFGVTLEPGEDASRITVEGFPLGALAVTDDRIIIGTAEEAVTAAGEDRMIDGELYRRLDGELPGEGLLLYVDVAGLVDVTGDETGDLDVFEAVAASATQDGSRFSGHLLVTFAEPTDDDVNE